MRLSRRERRGIVINITSLIDVVFILLIFLMITSTFIQVPGLRLDLPSAESAELHETEETVVYLTADGRLFLNEQPVSEKDLQASLKAALGPEGSVVVRADAQVQHGRVIEVMDAARRSGAKFVVMAARRPRNEGG